MATEQLTDMPVIDCQELQSLITSALDYGYQFDLGQMLAIGNPIEADPYYEATAEGLFDGRDLFFTDIENGRVLQLSKDKLLKAAFEYAKMYPNIYAEVGGADGYIPQVGMKILLVALYGWPMVMTEVGTRFERFLKL
ncbi:hypothetical protein [Barnesiella sp. WM24]|uniref:hypothetical protein n=1 Tax=Barnesiella sp. WM24 TaxID=2558278 RepID=UPI00142FED7B|nr:hypothetical protein [Barnesiella sp. WM24]